MVVSLALSLFKSTKGMMYSLELGYSSLVDSISKNFGSNIVRQMVVDVKPLIKIIKLTHEMTPYYITTYLSERTIERKREGKEGGYK